MSKAHYRRLVRETGVYNAAKVAKIMGVTLAQVQLWNREIGGRDNGFR